MKKIILFVLIAILIIETNPTSAQPINLPPGVTLRYFTSFENPNPFNLTTPVGNPGFTIETSLSFPTNAGQSVRGRMGVGQSSTLTTSTFSTLGQFKVWLDFAHIAKIEQIDAAEIQYSLNNGTTWTNLTGQTCRYFGASSYFRTVNKFTQQAYPVEWQLANTGAIPQNNATWWKNERFDISLAVGNQPNVMLRFFMSDRNNNAMGSPSAAYGWLLDSILVTSAFSELIPPLITHTPITGLQFNIAQTITATVRDSFGCDSTGIADVWLFYKRNSGSLDSLVMNRTGTTLNWTRALDTSRVADGDTVRYFIRAKDSSPSGNIKYFPNQVNPGDSFITYLASFFPTIGSHTAIQGQQFSPGPFAITANFTDASGIDSAILNYRINQGPWIKRRMLPIGNNNFRDSIFVNESGRVYYYLEAVDNSIRRFRSFLPVQNLGAITNWQFYVNSSVILPEVNSCLNDTIEIPIIHPTLSGVANAALRINYNPDSLTYVGFTNLNPNFAGMSITSGSGTLLMDWNAQTNQNIPSGNTVTLRFRVNGTSPLTWDTTFAPSEFSDINFNIIPQTFVNGSLTQNTQRRTWNRTICEGQSFSLGSQSFTTAGNYQGILPRSSGQCDTLVNLSLNVVPRETTLSATICSNQPYFFNGQSLTSSGVYRDTLTNALGCDSILVLNLTTHPSYNHPRTVRVCPGGIFNFGGNTLTTTGNYTHTFTIAEGCDSTVQLDFAVLDSIHISSSSGVNGFCPTFGVRLGMNAPITNAQYQWYRNGNLLSGEVSDTLMATQVGDYRLDVVISPTCTLSSNTLSISELNCNRVRGDLRYDNNPQTPLAGVPVHLKSLLGNIVMSDTTDSLGGYEMAGYANGNYVIDASVNYGPGGVNSTDALWVSRYFTFLLTLSPLRARAGDVTGNGVTNSLDALTISRRGANLITTFAAGDFVNSRPSVVAGGNPVDMNLRALSTGDVNGSYGVVVSTPVLVLDTVYSTFPTGTATVRFTTSGSGIYERGVCWGTSPSPTIAQNKSIAGAGGFGFTHSFGGLTGGILYYVRAYARNSSGTVYSNERSFTHATWGRCPGTPTATDIDGNVYNTVQIGNQCWTQSNLTVSKYRDGSSIPNITDNTQWSQTITSSTGAWCNYNNDAGNGTTYGKLYNWYAVNDSRGLCPTGWHVPTDAEWTTLENHLGGTSVAGGAMKSTGTTLWLSPNTGATNSSGFTGLPGGTRYGSGGFADVGSGGNWWSSSDAGSGSAWFRSLGYSVANVGRDAGDRRVGFSVRCARD